MKMKKHSVQKVKIGKKNDQVRPSKKKKTLFRVTMQLSEDLSQLVGKTMNKQSKQWNLARTQKIRKAVK